MTRKKTKTVRPLSRMTKAEREKERAARLELMLLLDRAIYTAVVLLHQRRPWADELNYRLLSPIQQIVARRLTKLLNTVGSHLAASLFDADATAAEAVDYLLREGGGNE
jgi:hypothetical protein